MSGGIYLIQEDGKLVAMREQDYDSESLKHFLAAFDWFLEQIKQA